MNRVPDPQMCSNATPKSAGIGPPQICSKAIPKPVVLKTVLTSKGPQNLLSINIVHGPQMSSKATPRPLFTNIVFGPQMSSKAAPNTFLYKQSLCALLIFKTQRWL